MQRVQYYVSHLYAGQLGKSENYLELKPVTLLSVLNHSIFPHQINYLSFHENIERETKDSYLNDMSYAFIELPKFNKQLDELKTEEDYWIFTMKEATHLREAPKDAPDEVKRAYEILEKHTWTREELLAYEKAKIALMDDLDAIRTAKEEGKEEGRKEGEQLKQREIAKKMLEDNISIQQICRLTGLSKEEIDQIKRLT
jgi:predicted transposase/invertase (TIGR01784 family)